MLLLVFAHGDVGWQIEEDVGGLEDGVGIEPDRHALAVLAGLLLELSHPVEPADARGALEEPGQLGMGRDGALREQNRFSRIDSTGDECSRHLADVRPKLGWIDVDGQRMEVGEEEEALGLVLHPHPSQDRAEKVAEMKIAGRLDSGKDAHLGIGAHHCRACFFSSLMSSRTNAPVTKQAIP